jgi:hypothetical protein
MHDRDPFALLLEHLETMILAGQAWEARALFMEHVAEFVVNLMCCTTQLTGVPDKPIDIETFWQQYTQDVLHNTRR